MGDSWRRRSIRSLRPGRSLGAKGQERLNGAKQQERRCNDGKSTLAHSNPSEKRRQISPKV
jgi:hypothetical protein